MKLISTTEYNIIQQKNLGIGGLTYQDYCIKVYKYALFLKQPLKLEMFFCSIPEPELQGGYSEDGTFVGGYDEQWIEEYQQAKEKCIFEFREEFKEWDKTDVENSKIEDLITDGFDIYYLTPNAIKQFNL